MSKTVELRKLMKSQLSKVVENVYYMEAHKDAKFPYAVYEFRNTNKTSSRDDIFMVVDIWDKNTDTLKIEELADDIEALLNHVTLVGADIYPTVYFDNRIPLLDEDKSLRRRQLQFTISNYEGGL